ncbi:MAG: RluA family pseudouridine synthase [Planctomycetaceae bacterium]
MAIVVNECQVTVERAGRLDRVVQELTGRSRADVRGLLDRGGVRLNGAACTDAGTLVKAGDAVTVRHDPHVRYRARPRTRESRAFRLVFEDEHLIVVDKDAAILTVPTSRGETNTLLDAVNRHVARQNPRGRATAIHRLDRGTSGLLVFAKNPRVARELRDQFRARKAVREYWAIVAGTLDQPAGTFESRLGTTKSLQRYSARPGQEGERAVTHFRVERRLAGATFVRVWLETGRRNQIRVHFAETGHPVLGDKRYQPELAHHSAWKSKRLALHAAVLGFEHPQTRQPLRFESPLPDEFARFLSQRR